MPNLEYPSVLRDQLAKEYKDNHILCPRCRNGHTVQGNFMDMCDYCCLQCVEGAADFVEMGRMTQDEVDRLVAGILEANKRWEK